MLTKFARPFIQIGEEIADARMVLFMASTHKSNEPEYRLDDTEKEHLRDCIDKIISLCPDLELPITEELFFEARKNHIRPIASLIF